MSSLWDKRFEEYKELWIRNGLKMAERELASIRAGICRHHDTFFHESHPDELSDGDRVMALKDAIAVLSLKY